MNRTLGASLLALTLSIIGGLSMSVIAQTPGPVAVAIHAGAGTISREDMTPEKEQVIRDTLAVAARAADDILRSGGSSLDAVTAAVVLLEDSPHFNAGRGAVFNAEGKNELDASIMDGSNLDAGAVAFVRNVRNPILLARKIMSDSKHVMLAGEGAETFAREQGIAFEPDDYFYTEHRWQQLEKARAAEDPEATYLSETPDQWFSTVGAVALDRAGNLAAATSTGGMTNKRWGRVGDSPIIGAGTYADNRSCAVSATGHGEFFIRATVAREICARMQHRGESLAEAADFVVMQQLEEMGGEGGVVAVDAQGHIAMPFNSKGMYRAAVGPDGALDVAIYTDD